MATIKLSPSRAKAAKTNGNGSAKPDYTVRDLSLAEWGRKTIQVSEHEMPGLMSIRKKYGASEAAQGRAHHRLAAHDHRDGDPHRDARRTRRVRALGELQHLLDAGPRRRRHCRRPAFRCSRTRAKRWRNTGISRSRALTHPGNKGPQLIVDDGGDATLLIHKGYELENGDNWVNTPSDNHEVAVIKALLQARREGTPRFLARPS